MLVMAEEEKAPKVDAKVVSLGDHKTGPYCMAMMMMMMILVMWIWERASIYLL